MAKGLGLGLASRVRKQKKACPELSRASRQLGLGLGFGLELGLELG